MPHYLITGGAGFIGSHLVDRLLSDGASVTVIDDLSTGRLENLAAARQSGRLSFFNAKASEYHDLSKVIAATDGVFHLAAAVGVDLVIRAPIQSIRTNLHETEVVLETAAAASVPVLITSTSEVYGKSARPDFAETDDLLIGPPTLSRWGYACSKLMDEFLALSYARERNLPVTVARIFNTVGPRQSGHYGMVLPRFISSALSGQPLRVFGDGTQTRCFCYVTDTVEALLRLQKNPDARSQVVNIGSAHEISIAALAQRVIDLTHSSSKIEFVPYHQAYAPGFEDMARRKPSIEKLRRLTNFQPTVPLDEIILKTAAAKC